VIFGQVGFGQEAEARGAESDADSALNAFVGASLYAEDWFPPFRSML
jgi:hypothetical protein